MLETDEHSSDIDIGYCPWNSEYRDSWTEVLSRQLWRDRYETEIPDAILERIRSDEYLFYKPSPECASLLSDDVSVDYMYKETQELTTQKVNETMENDTMLYFDIPMESSQRDDSNGVSQYKDQLTDNQSSSAVWYYKPSRYSSESRDTSQLQKILTETNYFDPSKDTQAQIKVEDPIPLRSRGTKRKLSSVDEPADESSHKVLKLDDDQQYLLPKHLPLKLAWKRRVPRH